MSHIQVVQEIGMTGMLRTGIGGRFIQYFADMINKQNPESKPQKESNDDKGDQKTYQNPDPQKKPNEEPENPLKEQK